ncbi:MAG: hypothetical protein IPL46_03475 [Saprospiraceae bacterium]|nr:hypothetical protein [Saprospiraceae bacterium]
MNKLLKLIIFLLASSLVEAQEFQGYILYQYTYLDSLGQDITSEMGPKMGLEQHYFIHGGNYAGVNEHGVLVQLYNANTNTYFLEMGGEIKSIPGDTEFPKQLEIQKSDNRIKVMQHECNSIVFITEMGTTTYYFNENISIDANHYDKHRFGNWSTYLREANGAIPLKFMTAMNGFTQIAEAIEIETENVDDQKFDILNYIRKE